MSLKQHVLALVRPAVAFDGWRPDGRVVVALVLLCCVASAASIAVTGDAVAAAVDGTVTVENPNKPPEWMCDGETAEYHDCDAPATVERSLQAAAAGTLDGARVKAALVPLVWTLLLAGLLVMVLGLPGRGDGEVLDAFTDGVGIAAVAAVPGLLRAAARPLAVERSLAGWSHPQTLEGVRTAAVEALFPDGTLWLAVLVVSALWTAAILYYGTRGAFGVGPKGAGAVAAAGASTIGASAIMADGGWFGAPGAMGLLLVVVALVGVLGSYSYITIAKTFELIGFSGSEKVDPRPWYVALHRIGAFVVLVVGFVLLDGIALL